MLLKNLSDNLVNGLIGHVQSATANSVTVWFPDLRKSETLFATVFSR